MNKILFSFLLISGLAGTVGCNSNDKKSDTEDFKKTSSAEIEKLKANFTKTNGWEMLPGDSANSFIISTKDSFMLCANLADDSVKMKFRSVYVLKPQLTVQDSLAMRKLQDSVTQASLALVDKITGARDSKEEAMYKAEDDKLSKMSPLMPAFSNGKYSVYCYEPDHHFCHEEKLDSEYELLQEAIKNYFMAGKFSFEDLLKLRVQEEIKMKEIQ